MLMLVNLIIALSIAAICPTIPSVAISLTGISKNTLILHTRTAGLCKLKWSGLPRARVIHL